MPDDAIFAQKLGPQLECLSVDELIDLVKKNTTHPHLQYCDVCRNALERAKHIIETLAAD